MKVSVIIPTRNRSKIVRECLNRILLQRYSPYEVIVVDDGSEDDTLDVLKDFSRFENFRYISIPERKGPAFCRNLGVKESTGEVLLFIDSDIFTLSNFIEEHINTHKAHREKILVVGPVIGISNLNESFPQRGSLLDFSNAYFASGNVSLSKDLFLQVGGFDELFNVYGWEDIEFGFKLKRLGVRSVKNSNAVGYHYQPLPSVEELEMLKEKERERAKTAIYLYKKYHSLEVKLMIQLTPFHRILNNIITGFGYINEKRVIEILRSNRSYNFKRFALTAFLTNVYLEALKRCTDFGQGTLT
ncbi:MAG: glycosyltransferase family 2 protein [bacterium]